MCLCHQHLVVVGVHEADMELHQLADRPAMSEWQTEHLKKKSPSENRPSQSKQHRPVCQPSEAPCTVLAPPPLRLKLVATSTFCEIS